MLRKKAGSRRRRRIAIPLVAAVAVAGAVTAGWGPYVHPQVDPLQKSDAIVVLGGAHDGREEYALDLAEKGYAPWVIFSNPYDDDDKVMNELCDTQHSFKVSCFVPEPSTTRGEGREIRDLAATYDWSRVIVVTFTPHVSRSRYIIEKCWDGDIEYAASPTTLPFEWWAWHFVYQTAGFIRASFEDC